MTTFEAADPVSWAEGPALDNPFEELASMSHGAEEACPWASSTARVCLAPT
jgi:hypothetical protein